MGVAVQSLHNTGVQFPSSPLVGGINNHHDYMKSNTLLLITRDDSSLLEITVDY